MQYDDKELVQRCQNGDPKAFQIIVQKYQKKLFSIAYGIVHNREDALDIVQETFLKVHRYIASFQGNSSLYTWLYRIVVNLCIDFIRKDNRAATYDYNDAVRHTPTPTQEANDIPFTHISDPIQALNDKELGEQIWKAMSALSVNHRTVIILREIEGMSYEEMAQTLQCSKGTIMSRLHHARANLRKCLEKYLAAGEPVSTTPIRTRTHRSSSQTTETPLSFNLPPNKNQSFSHRIEALSDK